MKTKSLLLVATLIAFSFFTSCEKEQFLDVNNEEEIATRQLQVTPSQSITIKNGYLSFYSVDDFYTTLDFIENSEENYYKWYRQFDGFKSAKALLDKVDSKIENAKTREENERILSTYSEIFKYSDELGLSYPFFSHSLAGVLNLEGLTEIAGVLYKFTEDDQIIVLDGAEETLSRYLKYKGAVVDNVVVLSFNDKSNSSWGVLDNPPPLYGNSSRLYSKIELVGIYSPRYVNYVFVGWYVGFTLKQTAYQQKKNIFNKWVKHKTEFTLRDGSYNIYYPLDATTYSNSNLYRKTECKDFTYTFKRKEYEGGPDAVLVRPNINSVYSRITSRGIGDVYITHDYSDF